ncbi:MAG: hypothetical protein K0T01_2777, partial [Acidimicrobiia bacterium]|nr:hypothetical protein [Acidimicrobiia bacterium]
RLNQEERVSDDRVLDGVFDWFVYLGMT